MGAKEYAGQVRDAAKTVAYKTGAAAYKAGAAGLRGLGKVPLKVPRAGGKFGARVEINRTVLIGEAIARKARETRDAAKAVGYKAGTAYYKQRTSRANGKIWNLRITRDGQQVVGKMARVGQQVGAQAQVVGKRLYRQAMKVGQGTSRTAQILGLLTLPFFMVAAIVAAEVLLQILLGFVPAGFVAADFISFLLGASIFVGTFACCFAWVRTGGFHVFT